MTLYDWLLFLHVLSAFVLVGALTALWGLVLSTRPSAAMLAADEAMRFGRIAGPLVGVGTMGTLVFGIWLALDVDRYHIWDAWIVAALVLWAVAGGTGARAGKAFAVGGRQAGIRLQAVNTVAVLAILVLMIWKPGA